MDNDLLKILSEELRGTKTLVTETRKIALAAEQTALESKRQADAAWELVMITRNQVQEEIAHLKMPWWKKLFGQAA
ncbi:MAG: hypothetical protein RIB47_04705 [Cyclobacteriaceae bacterium]